MPLFEQPVARGIENLGSALFGSPQDDVAISQAQNFQASRQKTLQEIQQERQAQQALQGLGDILAGTNMQDPAAMEAIRQAIPLAIQGGMEPSDMAAFARFGIGTGGGSFDQFTGATIDPAQRLAIEEANRDRDQMARTQDILTEQFGPGLGVLFAGGGGDLSDVERRAAVLAANNPDVTFTDAHNALTAGSDVVTTEHGNVLRVPNELFAGRSRQPFETIHSPGASFVASLPPEQRDALGSEFLPQGGAQPAPQGQPTPAGQQQPGGQVPPPAQAGQAQGSGQGQQSAAGEPGQGRPTRLTDIQTEDAPRTPEEALNMGPVVGDETREAGFSGLYDIVPLASSPAGGLKRASSKFLGGFFDRFSFPDAKGAKADMGLFNAKIRPLLTVSNRPSRMELEWINDILVGHEWFSNPADDFRVLMGIEDSLKRSRGHLNQALAGNLTGAERSELSAARRLTEELLSEFGQRPEGEVSGQDIFMDEMGDFFGQVFGEGGPGDDVQQFGNRLGETFNSATSGGQQGGQGQQGADLEDLSDEELMRRLQGGQ